MINAIILAAGKGTRMYTSLPKCATPLLNKPLIEYLVDSLNKTKVDNIIAIVGHKKEVLEDILKDKVKYAIQTEQLGTGHAVKCATNLLDDEGISIIMPGDAPLIDEKVITSLINNHYENNNTLTVGTFIFDNPFGYGRIVRNGKTVSAIVEEKDATQEQKLIKEVNSGLYCVNNKELKEALLLIKNDNVKGEYYLTDIVKLLSKEHKVDTFTIKDVYKLQGVNDLNQLASLENELEESIKKNLLVHGVRMENVNSILIAKDVIIEPDVVIRPNTVITGKSLIKSGSIIGPNSELHNVIIGNNVKASHVVIKDTEIEDNTTLEEFKVYGGKKYMVTTKELYSLEHSLAGSYLSNFTYPWEALKGIKDLIIELGKSLPKDEYDEIEENVWVAKSAKVFKSAYIGSPAIIGKNTEVRQCAFIRGSALVGDNCVIGNSVELKNVIIFDNTQVPHYNYVGDSILGYHSHMGAGSLTSNVKSDKTLVVVKDKNTKYETGLKKFGAMLGDYVEVGCNSVLNPGTVVGKNTNIYPLSCVRGVIKENSIYKTGGIVVDKK